MHEDSTCDLSKWKIQRRHSVVIFLKIIVLLDRYKSFVTEMSKHIKIKSEEKDGTNEDRHFDYYLPMFIFAIRDFCLDLTVEGKELTPNEYLEYCLTLKPEVTENDKVIIL